MMDLTVALCMYNAERYIEETLECILNQTVKDFHLLILNDCSTDNSRDIVVKFFENHPFDYELKDMPENGGLAVGRNFVEHYVTTKYLMFIDADDLPYPTLIEKTYSKITSDEDLMAVGYYMEYINLKSKRIRGGVYLGETTKEGFYKKAAAGKRIFMTSTAMYNREIALSVGGHNIEGFPEGKPRYQDLCEDLDLWTRMSDLYVDKKAIVVLPEVLYKYRKGDGMSGNSTGMVLRMRHIKTNVKRRRRGLKDLTFIEFREQMSQEEYDRLEKDARAADNLRHAYYSMKKGDVFSGCIYLITSVYNRPGYIVDKIKHNLLHMK